MTFSGSHVCRRCHQQFEWEFTDDGRSRGSWPRVSEVMILEPNHNKAICRRQIDVPYQSEFLVTHCPHCQADISIECSESILEALYT